MSNFAPAAENAIKVIEGIASENEPIGISELSRKLNINKNMIFRILNSLETSGWIYMENVAEKKYGLTLKPFYITARAGNRLTLNHVATPLVYELWKQTGESTYLGIKSEDKVLYLQHFDGIGDVRVAGMVGGRYELYCTAPGKVLLAYSDEEFVKNYLNQNFVSHTANTITDSSKIEEELEIIRRNGFAMDNEELGQGILCLAAPVFDAAKTVVATVGGSVSTIHYDAESLLTRLKPLIMETAKMISQRLGFSEE